jgi:hypothetical protein
VSMSTSSTERGGYYKREGGRATRSLARLGRLDSQVGVKLEGQGNVVGVGRVETDRDDLAGLDGRQT